jgi:hypothetical protein
MVLPQDFHGDDIYIETHLGGGAIMQRKAPARHNIGIDPDARALAGLRCDYPVERVHGWCPPVPGRVSVHGPRAGLLRPALTLAHPPLAAALTLLLLAI